MEEGGESESPGESEEDVVLRAYSATCLEEERHAVLGRAHLLLAARCRKEMKIGSPTQRLEAIQDYHRQVEEFDRRLRKASNEILAERGTMLAAMTASGHRFDSCSERLRSDAEVTFAAFRTWPEALNHATMTLLGDRTFMERVIQRRGTALEFASTELQDDRDLVLAAVRRSPWALEAASERLRGDRDVVLKALEAQTEEQVCDHPNALEFASQALRSDPEIVLESLRVDGSAIELASQELRSNKDFLLRAMRTVPAADEHYCLRQAQEEELASQLAGACKSVLALTGEAAPVVNIDLSAESAMQREQKQHEGQYHASSDNDDNSNSSTNNSTSSPPAKETHHLILKNSCLATLLSGVSFTCSLGGDSSSSKARSLGSDDSAGSQTNLPGKAEETEEEREESRRKRARHQSSNSAATGVGTGTGSAEDARADSSTSPATAVTVGDLAQVVLAELPKYMQVDPPARRVFLVFTKNGESDGVTATPWDWNRQLTEFL